MWLCRRRQINRTQRRISKQLPECCHTVEEFFSRENFSQEKCDNFHLWNPLRCWPQPRKRESQSLPLSLTQILPRLAVWFYATWRFNPPGQTRRSISQLIRASQLHIWLSPLLYHTVFGHLLQQQTHASQAKLSGQIYFNSIIGALHQWSKPGVGKLFTSSGHDGL